MSEQKRYTAQEMREVERDLCVHRYPVIEVARRMLRQAADAEEELERALKNEKALELRVDFWRFEHNALKARLEAVVKIASDNLWCEDSGIVETDTCAKLHNSYMSDILRAARGEGGAE